MGVTIYKAREEGMALGSNGGNYRETNEKVMGGAMGDAMRGNVVDAMGEAKTNFLASIRWISERCHKRSYWESHKASYVGAM